MFKPHQICRFKHKQINMYSKIVLKLSKTRMFKPDKKAQMFSSRSSLSYKKSAYLSKDNNIRIFPLELSLGHTKVVGLSLSNTISIFFQNGAKAFQHFSKWSLIKFHTKHKQKNSRSNIKSKKLENFK